MTLGPCISIMNVNQFINIICVTLQVQYSAQSDVISLSLCFRLQQISVGM